MMATIREKFLENPDENYQRCYISNLKILAFDACAAGVHVHSLRKLYRR